MEFWDGSVRVEGLGLSCCGCFGCELLDLLMGELRTRLPKSLVDIFFSNITIINWDLVLNNAIHVFKA